MTCGNGLIELLEACDDSNTDIGDGCSDTCTIEDGWCCGQESPSDCAPVLFDLNEEDGLNITDGKPVNAYNTSMRFLNPEEFVTCVGVPVCAQQFYLFIFVGLSLIHKSFLVLLVGCNLCSNHGIRRGK